MTRADSPATLREWLSAPPAWFVIAASLAMIAALSVVDYFSGSEVSFSIFYLGPVLWATWYVGRRVSIIVAVIASITWGVVDVAAGSVYSSPVITIWNSLMRFGFFLIALMLLGELKQSESQAVAMARTDPLTGLYNSRMLHEELDKEISRQRRFGHPLGLVYVDLDHFKSVNDTLGHSAGDRLLADIGGALILAVRASDTVARVGGDEFVIILPETDASEIGPAIERIRVAINGCLGELAKQLPALGATVGGLVFTSAPASSDAAVGEADKVMYVGKRGGRNQANIEVL